MVTSGEESPYQCARNESHLHDTESVRPPSSVSDTSSHRQQNSLGICQQGGRNQVLVSHEGDFQSLPSSHGQQLDPQGQIHPRQPECHCRSAVQTRSDPSHGVVSPSSSGERPIQQVGHSSGGPICHQVQSQVRVLCIPSSRPSSLGGRCPNPRPRGTSGVRVSSSTDTVEIPTKVSANQTVQSHSSGTLLAETALVSTVISTHSGQTSSSSSLAKPTQAASVQSVQSQGGDSQTPCLAAREMSLQVTGFQSEVIQKLTKPHAPSTEAIYDGKWKSWSLWCTKNRVDCYNPSIAQIADFLQYLFATQKVEYSTVAGYRSMLSGALFHTGLNVGQDKDLSDLMLPLRKHVHDNRTIHERS